MRFSTLVSVVLVAIVHGLEFTAVYGDDGVGEKVQTTAECNKLAAHRHTALIAEPLSRRKSAMVLNFSGILNIVSEIYSYH